MKSALPKLGVRKDPKIVGKAFELYLSGMPLCDIDRELGWKVATTYRLSERLGWNRQRAELISHKQKTVAERFTDFQNEHFDEVLESKLAITRKLDAHLVRHLDRKRLSTKGISDIARAAGTSADISGRLVGLNRLTEEKQKPMLIQLGVQVQLADQGKSYSPRHQVVEVEPIPNPAF